MTVVPLTPTLLVGTLLEIGGMGLVLFLTWVTSNYTLFSSLERYGLLCVFLLVASLVWLPLMIWRPSSLKHRRQAWPRWVSIGVLVLVAAVLVAGGLLYAMAPHSFL